MSDEDQTVEEIIDLHAKIAEVVDDEITMYFGDADSDKQLAWFITDAITNDFYVLPSLDAIDTSITIYMSQQNLDDIFYYCREKNIKMQDFILSSLKEAIHQ